MSATKRRDYVAKNMNKSNRGAVHKSKKAYSRKPKYKDNPYAIAC